ncbi:MAG TPA: reverse transcriptase domain-containing protein [Cyclobacteriaceae bacterium]|nr:reverse transcriptase domain-containing protein [Cyclobacteriaceae bacterium]
MYIKLQSDDATLITKFSELKTIEDICSLLEIDKKSLIYLLYRKSIETNYKSFTIKKRSGGDRIISSPVESLKIIQQKLNVVLSLIYKPRPSVHGFCLDRSIVTNAKIHSKKAYVFNLDLENFFPSINFGRVRGLFIAHPFNFPAEVATILAQISIFNNELPQGSPISPIISNFICSSLDGQLQELARRNNLLYTRYADDITFSSWEKFFPEIILKKTAGSPVVGVDLEKIINSNGFIVNQKKVRVSSSRKRQEVTGLINNKFPNVKRDYVREVRVMLYNWEKYGITRAKSEYILKNGVLDRNPAYPEPDFKNVILGKINFLKMVKGYRNPVYRKLINKYNILGNTGYPNLAVEESKLLAEHVWILEINGQVNGTGFLLEDYGLITCNHVLDLSGEYFAYRPSNPRNKYRLDIVKQNSIADLAILTFRDSQIGLNFPYLKKSSTPVIVRDLLLGIGFPLKYSEKEAFFYESKAVAFKDIFFISRIVLDMPFTSGMSGGPLLNNRNEVVGVIATGSPNFTQAHDIIGYTAVPINCIDGI